MADFTDREISENIDKIRKMYTSYAAEYSNKKAFDVNLFNDRYFEALKGRINLTTFIKAELEVIEELRKRAEHLKEEEIRISKEREEKDKKNFMNKVDSMLETFADSIRKYPSKKVHQHASEEINRIHGSFNELYSCFRIIKPVLTSLNDYGVETILKDLDNKFQPFTLEGSYGRPPHIFLDYYDALEAENEPVRSEQFVLKEAGFFLHFIVAKFDQMAPLMSKIPNDAIIKIPDYIEKESPRVYKSFSGKTQVDTFFATKAYAASMIEDFRLQHFRQNEK